MKTALILAVLAPFLAGCAGTQMKDEDDRVSNAWGATQNWSADSRAAARKLIEQCGPPDHIDAGRLVWFHSGPWKRIEVWDLMSSRDVIEETVAYQVPFEKRAALQAFSDKLHFSQDGSELSVRGPSEAENFLTVNLAAEILKGYTGPEEARKSFAQAMDLRASGKSSSFTEGLRFPGEL